MMGKEPRLLPNRDPLGAGCLEKHKTTLPDRSIEPSTATLPGIPEMHRDALAGR